MDGKFYHGQEVNALYFPGEQILEAGSGECDRITICIELDQLWFVVWKAKEILTKWNAIYVEGLDLRPQQALQ